MTYLSSVTVAANRLEIKCGHAVSISRRAITENLYVFCKLFGKKDVSLRVPGRTFSGLFGLYSFGPVKTSNAI